MYLQTVVTSNLKMDLILISYFILTLTVVDIFADNVAIQNETSRQAKSLLQKMLFPKTKTESTVNHHDMGVHNSFGMAGNMGFGFHFGGGYRIKNGDGKDEQQIVHSKIYDKYMGTSFGFGSLSNAKIGHVNDVKQSVSEDQQIIYHDDAGVMADQESGEQTSTSEKPKPGMFRKISSYWTSGQRSEPKSDYASAGILKWNVKKFKNKDDIGTPR